MKLQQLRFVREVLRSGLNVSAAAETLYTAQPGVSNQIKLLEDELQVQIFERNGKRLVGVTEPGKIILRMTERILQETENIKRVGAEFSNETKGSLTIATTHTQARYALPPVIKVFRESYPDVRLHLAQGSPTQIAEMVATGAADIAVATEAIHLFEDLIMMPCYEWNRCVVALAGHPVLDERPLTLEVIAKYPLITYDFAFAGRSKINEAFAAKGLQPNVIMTAIDSDVIKTYVELGLGIGLLAAMAFDDQRDVRLRSADVGHLFASSTTRIGIRRGMFLRGYMYAFIELFAPHLTRNVMNEAMAQGAVT